MTEQEVMSEAVQQYHTDPLFHARVHVVKNLLANDVKDKHHHRMSDEDQSLVMLAAAVALVIVELSPGELVNGRGAPSLQVPYLMAHLPPIPGEPTL